MGYGRAGIRGACCDNTCDDDVQMHVTCACIFSSLCSAQPHSAAPPLPPQTSTQNPRCCPLKRQNTSHSPRSQPQLAEQPHLQPKRRLRKVTRHACCDQVQSPSLFVANTVRPALSDAELQISSPKTSHLCQKKRDTCTAAAAPSLEQERRLIWRVPEPTRRGQPELGLQHRSPLTRGLCT
jgi:hypothetical protein